MTLRDWVPVLLSAMDTTNVDRQPKRDSSPVHAVFFVIFIFIGSFYMLKLFVGIIVAHFRQFSGTALLTPQQQVRGRRVSCCEPALWQRSHQSTPPVQEYLMLRRIIASTKPELNPPTGRLRSKLFRTATSFSFEVTTTAVMVLHVVLLCFRTANPSDDQVRARTRFAVLRACCWQHALST